MEESTNQQQELANRLASSNAFIANLQSEKETLVRSLEESTNQKHQLENRLARSDAVIANLQSEKETLVSSMEESTNQQQELERLARSNAVIANFQLEKETLARSMEELTNQQQELANRLASSDAVIANLRSEKETLVRSLEESTNQNPQLENRLARSNAVIAKLQSEKETLVRSMEESMEELTNQKKQLEDRLASAIMNKSKAKESLRTAEEKLSKKARGTVDAKDGKIQSQLKAANRANAILKARVLKLEITNESNEGCVRKLTSERNSANAADAENRILQSQFVLQLENANKLNEERIRELTSERNCGNADKVSEQLILDKLDLSNFNDVEGITTGRNNEEQGFGNNQHLGNSPVGGVVETQKDKEAGQAKSPLTMVPRKKAAVEALGVDSSREKSPRSHLKSTTENPSPGSSVGRISEESNSEEERSISSGTSSGFSASVRNMDANITDGTEEDVIPGEFRKHAKDFWGVIQTAKDVVSESQSRKEEEGGKLGEEPPLVAAAGAAVAAARPWASVSSQGSSKFCQSSMSLLVDEEEMDEVDGLTSRRTSSRKRKMYAQGQRESAKDIHTPNMPTLIDPQLPSTGHCEWSYDKKSRVLLANFHCKNRTGKIQVTSQDEAFLFRMMELDNITVISEGLADEINPSLWTREYIEGRIGSEYHHKFRVFETISNKNGPEQQKEKEGWYSMKVSDYFQYLEQRSTVKDGKLDSTNKNERLRSSNMFSFTDNQGNEKAVNVDNEAIYMLDVDMVKILPQLFEDFQHNFKLPGILPGGSHCMLNAVNVSGRPYMGPNLFITPPSSFTQFHQDGHGTVDSGHLCLSGYNEVIMLRRLSEKEKCHALQLLTGTSDSHNTLYDFPHQDDLETQLSWPSKESIRQCEEMGFCPSVFILKAGQVLHINKGRLHAFRKLAPSTLCKTDCHFDLRNEVMQTKEQPTEENCFSVAWDWMYKGVTSDGINREVSAILECARLNRERDLQSLAIPETSLLFLAKENIATYQLKTKISASNPLFGMDIPLQPTQGSRSEPDAETVLRGILPSLTYVVNNHKSAAKKSERIRNKKKSSKVSIDLHPKTWENPATSVIDPYDVEDFSCKACGEELSNVYMHCDGCEKLLNKDHNLCVACHTEGKCHVFHQVNPFTDKQDSMLNHTGNLEGKQKNKCCGQTCTICSYCTGCSCTCHQCFTLHFRFMGMKDEVELLENAKSIVRSAKGFGRGSRRIKNEH